MRVYAYYRIDDLKVINDCDVYLSSNISYEIPKSRVVYEQVKIDIPVKYRDKFINLINHSMESGDMLFINDLDSLGSDFNEIDFSLGLIFKKRIRLICLRFSKNEITGDMKKIFIHFIKMSCEFEENLKKSKKSNKNNKSNKEKVIGRPEILDSKQKSEIIRKFKKGQSVYSIAKQYSVSRTVIQRLISQSCNAIKLKEN